MIGKQKNKTGMFGKMVLVAVFLCGGHSPAAAQRVKELVVLHTNDIHSRVEPIGESVGNRNAGQGGAVRRAGYINGERERAGGLLLFDCGDFSQGTPYYNIFAGEVEVRLMNAMGYDAMTIGNHEFDFGLENMRRLFEMAEFPVVCANYDFTGSVLEGIVKPYVVIVRDGLRIGVLGVGTILQGLVQEKNFGNVVFLDPYAAANKAAAHLRQKEKCDVVICLSHLGWKAGVKNSFSDELLIANTRDIDLVLGGHSHSLFENLLFYKNLDGKEIPLHQVGDRGLYVGKITMKLEKKKRKN